MSYQDHHDVEVLADINAELRTRAEKLEVALRELYTSCLDVPDFRPDCQVMRQAREALE